MITLGGSIVLGWTGGGGVKAVRAVRLVRFVVGRKGCVGDLAFILDL